MSELNNKINELRTLKKSYSDLADSQNNIIEKLSHMAMSSRSVDGVYSVSEGISLAHLYGNTSDRLSVTTIKDKNTGWKLDASYVADNIVSLFPNVSSIEFGCAEITGTIFSSPTFWNGEIILKALEIMPNTNVIAMGGNGQGCPNCTLHAYNLKTSNQYSNGTVAFVVGKMYFHDYESGVIRLGGSGANTNHVTNYVFLGCKGDKTQTIMLHSYYINSAITDIEIGEGACQNLDISLFTAITEDNMVNHILKKLKQDEELCGSGVTITLGATNLAKLTSEEAVALLDSLTNIYGYTFA